MHFKMAKGGEPNRIEPIPIRLSKEIPDANDDMPRQDLLQNMVKVQNLLSRITSCLMQKDLGEYVEHADPCNFSQAFSDAYQVITQKPEKWMQHGWHYCESLWRIWENCTRRFQGEITLPPLYQADPKDRRFSDHVWSEHPFFNYLQQTYLMTQEWCNDTLQDLSVDMDTRTTSKIRFFMRQWLDSLSPSNYMWTNPTVLKALQETKGESLVQGMQHLLEDIQQTHRLCQVRMTDTSAFTVGKNVATTPGKVIYENELMQLIHYEPAKETCFELPLLVIPPWINKYYILDLQPHNSLIRWMVDQGYSVFLISWVNPDASLSHKSFEDYMFQGPLAAIDAITKATGMKEMNVLGYCIGGTLLGCTLAYLTQKGRMPFKAATFMTTLLDFSIPGDLGLFIEESQLPRWERYLDKHGFVDGWDLAALFAFLRANDLVWSFVVNNYLLGKKPLPFDLLYWNMDATRLPAEMQRFYMRHMYTYNDIVKPGFLTLGGVPIDLSVVQIPLYFLATKEDHITPWMGIYKGAQCFTNTMVRFCLSASGHVAGVVNPPLSKNIVIGRMTALLENAETWLSHAKETAGSWWPDWHQWHQAFAGQHVPAYKPGSGKLKPIEEAPGRYVRQS